MSHKYFFMVYPFSTGNSDDLPTLFIYETENNDDKGKYNAYSGDEANQDSWNGWLRRRYYTPIEFASRFGYSTVQAGPLRDEEHFQELLRKAGIVKKEEINDNPPS
jgi:hypothetical protein